MTERISIHTHGGPEVMQLEHVDLGAPEAGQVRVRHTAIGVNYIDIYHRSGLYPLPLPSGLGIEAVGVVEASGAGVTSFSDGERVCYLTPPPGAYASARNYSAQRLVSVPPSLDGQMVAAGFLKGMTAWFLLRHTFRVMGDTRMLVYAAAGGVGQMLAQWGKALGATVYGVVGSKDKVEVAMANGCDRVWLLDEDYVAAIKTLGGVDVAYDSLGAKTFLWSLECLVPRGMMVSFGNATGPLPAFDPVELGKRGSLFFTRPSLMDYTAAHEDLVSGANMVFDCLQDGILKPTVGQSFALADAADAHRALESRQTTGSTILWP